MKEAWMDDASGVEMEANALDLTEAAFRLTLKTSVRSQRAPDGDPKRDNPSGAKARGWSKVKKKSGSVLHVTSRLAADPPASDRSEDEMLNTSDAIGPAL